MMKKIIAMLLTLAMTLSCVAGLAENTKHERVYVVTSSDGSIQSITDNIRLENADASDVILDQTLLTDIQNLSGEETFTLAGEELTWQASGRDITYQGTSDKTPAVLPVVTLTLDGQEVTAEELKEKAGEVTLKVDYQALEQLPALAVSILLLPEEGVTDLKMENATVMSEMGRQILVGWAAPGLDAELELPSSFSATFQADHAELNWMMTLTTSDPIDTVCSEIESRVDLDAHLELDEIEQLLTALSKGETLPETTGKTKDIVPKINELNDGLTELDDGAKELADGTVTLADGAAELKTGAKSLDDGASSLKDGASSLKDGAKDLDTGASTLSDALAQISDGASSLKSGASQLSTGSQTLAVGLTTVNTGAASLDDGLKTLIENNDALNEGANTIFTAILATANQQIAASGLDAAGITLPELTAENYADALTAVLDQLNPDTLKAAASAQVEAVVRPQVEANKDQVQAGVEAAVQAKVLEAVLQAAGQDMTAEQYTQAVAAGAVSSEVAQQISAAVDQQMATDEVQAQIEKNVQAQIDQLVQENVENYLATDETVAAQLASAQSGYDTLSALKEQLDQINTFVTGVQAYTAGAKQASTGATALANGISQLNSGAATLKDGAIALADGASTLADGASQAADGAVSLHEGTTQLADGASTLYDGTVSLKDGTASLVTGVNTLADGTVELKDGANTLRETGTKKLKETLQDAEKEAAEKLLPYVQDDLRKALRIYEETRDNAKNTGYDLRPEDMKTVTVFIIRTDLK